MSADIISSLVEQHAFIEEQFNLAQKSYNDWGKKLSEIRKKIQVVQELGEDYDLVPKPGKANGNANASDTAILKTP